MIVFLKRTYIVFFMLISGANLYAQQIIEAESITLRGTPRYKNGWTHFDYVNPQAPKGGTIVLGVIGTFDNFHRYALRGDCAALALSGDNQLLYDTLMTTSSDETDTMYPLIASKIEYSNDYSYITFYINPNAKDHSGRPITAEDVEFTFNMFMEKGVPQFRSYFEGVSVRVLPQNKVRFDLKINREKEMLMSIANTTVFPKHFWQGKDFSEPLLSPPIGSGPYRVSDYKMGQYVVLSRNSNYWARDLPVNKGRYNFDTIRFDYYRDANVSFEAFKAGEYDFREENSASNWATGYTGYKNNALLREELSHEIAQPTQAIVFNTERSLFKDRRVRMALNYFFDFEWMNKNLFYNQYKRTRSYFSNTEYEARSLPSKEELEILNPLRGKIPDEVFTSEYNPPHFAGDGNTREQARIAIKLLSEAGWNLKDGKLLDSKGKQMEFELMIYDTSTERFAVPFANVLKRYGINMNIRTIDTSQYVNRLRSRDFDVLSRGFHAEQHPSSSLLFPWNSKYIDSTYNTAGVQDEAIDYLTEMIAANQEDGEKLLFLGRSLDRVLTWNTYIIPQWYYDKFRIAYKNKFERPKIRAKYNIGLDTWWVKK
ncbi:MAG: extracellular solute-binding protein [Termitinemataceae bacterium]|nr:MAG: extracellular solute-binding protein [Termitinemataceae bacterium]